MMFSGILLFFCAFINSSSFANSSLKAVPFGNSSGFVNDSVNPDVNFPMPSSMPGSGGFVPFFSASSSCFFSRFCSLSMRATLLLFFASHLSYSGFTWS